MKSVRNATVCLLLALMCLAIAPRCAQAQAPSNLTCVPDIGSVGDVFYIFGNNIANATQVQIGHVVVSFQEQTNIFGVPYLVCVVPPGAYTFDVYVLNAGPPAVEGHVGVTAIPFVVLP